MFDSLEKTLILPAGLELSYLERGDRRGRALLLLHGYTDSFRSCRRMIAHLPPAMRVIAPSFRGHGDSSKPPSSYCIAEHAHDIARLLDALALDQVVIAGHSMGSMVAQRLAVELGDRVRGLILLGAFRGLGSLPAIQALWHDNIHGLQDPLDPALVRAFQESTIARPVPATFLNLVVAESLKVPAFVWRAALRAQLDEDLGAELHRVRAPAMVIWGDRDTISPHAEQLGLSAALAAELHVLRGVGHALHWEEPGAVAALITRFVSSLDSEPARPERLELEAPLLPTPIESTP